MSRPVIDTVPAVSEARPPRPTATPLLATRLLPLLLALTGCIPEERWLDDSSGFVYSIGRDKTTQEIRFYDVIRRAQHLLWSGSDKAGADIDPAEQLLFVIQSKRQAGNSLFGFQLSVYGIKSNRLLRRPAGWTGMEMT